MTGNTFGREELIAAFDVFEQTVDRAAQTRDWDPWTDHYTEDVLYMDPSTLAPRKTASKQKTPTSSPALPPATTNAPKRRTPSG